MDIASNSLQNELIEPLDHVVFTEDLEQLKREGDTILIDGKEKKIKYKQFDPAANLGVIGQIARDFGPRVVQGTNIGGVLGNVIKFISSSDGQELLRVVGEQGKKAFGNNGNKSSTQQPGGKKNNTSGGGQGKAQPRASAGEPNRNSAASSMFTNMPPLVTTINTPISKRTLSEDLAIPKDDEPLLHICGVRFALQVNEPDDVIYKWFNEVVAPDFQNLASLSVNYGLNAESVFSTDNLISYMNSVAYALQVYYFYVSIIAYENNIPHNKNAGMKFLRSQMKQQDMYDLETLSRTIRTLPVPPRLNDVCFFLSQPFKVSDCAFASICKFMPFGFNSSANGFLYTFGTYDSTHSILQHAIDTLNQPAIGVLTTKLANIVPDWLDMRMYSPGPVPVYNLTLCDIWANAPIYSMTTNAIDRGRTTAFPCWRDAATGDNNTNLHYVSKSDSPDAIAIALFGGFKRGLWEEGSAGYDRLRPGLLGPEVTYYSTQGSNFNACNVLTYYKKRADTSAAFWPMFDYGAGIRNILITDIGKSAYFHNWETTYDEGVCRPAGYDSISYASVENARYSAKQLVEWIMNLETMQVKAENAIKKRSPYNSKGSKLKTS